MVTMANAKSLMKLSFANTNDPFFWVHVTSSTSNEASAIRLNAQARLWPI